MNKHIFISGIDTDCGKTYITGLLAKSMNDNGVKCITSKFVQTGCTGVSEDLIEHRKIMGIDLLPEDIDKITCPFVYTFPASPHLSAQIDKIKFDVNAVINKIEILKKRYDLVLTEGAGGLTVPLTKHYLTSDYLKDNKIPLILVASSKLGSLNHAILSIEFCKSNNIQLHAVIYNQFPTDNKQIADSSFLFLKDYLAQKYPEVKISHVKDLLKHPITELIN